MPAVSQRGRCVILHLSTPRCWWITLHLSTHLLSALMRGISVPTVKGSNNNKRYNNKKLKARPKLAPRITRWHPISHTGTQHHMLAPHIICWHSISHVGTKHHTLALHITCWHPTSNAGTPYHMLAPHITRWHPTSYVGTPYHMLAPHIKCEVPHRYKLIHQSCSLPRVWSLLIFPPAL